MNWGVHLFTPFFSLTLPQFLFGNCPGSGRATGKCQNQAVRDKWHMQSSAHFFSFSSSVLSLQNEQLLLLETPAWKSSLKQLLVC